MSYMTAQAQLVSDLKTGAVDGNALRVVEKLEDVNPPCVLVAMRELDHTLGLQNGDASFHIYVVPPASADELRALKGAEPYLDEVLSLVSPTDVTRFVNLATPGNTTPLYALEVSTSRPF